MRVEVRTTLAWLALAELAGELFELAGRRASLVEGLRELMASDVVALDEALTAYLAEERVSLLDTHPGTAVRIAGYERLIDPAAAAQPASGDPALELIRGGAGWLAEHEGDLIDSELPLTSWQEVAVVGGDRAAVDAARWLAEHLQRAGVTEGVRYADVLAAAESVRWADLGRYLVDDDEDPEAGVREALGTVLVAGLVEAGAARHVLHWPDAPVPVTIADGAPLDAADVVAGAAERPAALGEYLSAQGLDLTTSPGADAGGEPRLLAAMTVLRGPWPGLADGLVYSTGLAFVPTGKSKVGALVKDRPQERMETLLQQRLADLQAQPGAVWIALDDIEAAQIAGLLDPAIDLRLRDGRLVVIRASSETESIEDPQDTLRYLLGRRATKGAWTGAASAAATALTPGAVASWLWRDLFARLGWGLLVATVIAGALFGMQADRYSVLSNQEGMQPATVTVLHAATDKGVQVRFLDPALRRAALDDPPEKGAVATLDRSVFIDPAALRTGQEVSILVRADDPTWYAQQPGAQLDQSEYYVSAVAAAAALVLAVAAFAVSWRRLRRTYGPGGRS